MIGYLVEKLQQSFVYPETDGVFLTHTMAFICENLFILLTFNIFKHKKQKVTKFLRGPPSAAMFN